MSMSFLSVGDCAAIGRLFLFWFFRGSAQLRTSCHNMVILIDYNQTLLPFLSFLKDFFENLFFCYILGLGKACDYIGKFQTIEVTFKGTLLLILKGVQADLTLSPDVTSYGSSPWVMLTRFFAMHYVLFHFEYSKWNWKRNQIQNPFFLLYQFSI